MKMPCVSHRISWLLDDWPHVRTSDIWTHTHTHIHTLKLIHSDKNHQTLWLIIGSSLHLSSSKHAHRQLHSLTLSSCNTTLFLSLSLSLFQLRYQKCLVARPPSQKACSSSPPGDSVSRRVSTSVKRGVLSLIDTLKHKRPVTELPQ